MANQLVIILCFSTFLILSHFTSLSLSKETNPSSGDDDDEDLSFLEEPEDGTPSTHDTYDQDLPDFDEFAGDEDEDDFDNFNYNDDEFEVPAHDYNEEEEHTNSIDDKDVVVLVESNFTDIVESNRYVMVEFYAPWCGHCKALAPEYAAAATELKGEPVVLAKVDAQEESDLAETYEVQGFPTVLFFVDGVHKPYLGQRTKDAIVNWIKKKTGPGVYNITTVEDAEKILASEDKVVLAFVSSLVGPENEELAAASKLDDDVNFYQTIDPNVAKLFQIDPDVKLPALVLLKKDAEKVTHHDGLFDKSAIKEFVFANKLPLVTTFSRESASLIFESPIKKQVMLFATSMGSTKVAQTFVDAAKLFKGKLIFVYVDMDNEDVGKPVGDYFSITGDAPQVIGYTGNDDAKKFVFDGDLTVENLKAFGEKFLDDKLKAFYKSDPIPEHNDGDVKIVVGNNFDDMVLDESKDVLLEIYAPWCGHCQALEPTYSKLAKHLRDIDSLVIAKMDGSTNEHPKAKADGYPTLLFYPAGNKSSDPISVDVDRTVVAFYKFLKKHASIPFKLQKPTYTDAKQSSKDSNIDKKDEL
ncbi:protein disulfide isomerase-like 1-4 [Cynara cardunculus var. scolymus]|uniref:protein disulfide isomerase-like 1-4 n=1 Tax=Cynara cardunculus var. scolymus TaxID=59895 RepID=UPI000D6286FC|nr:protein disulfide isomerase-like 1-4 [Cynara cardunculus var. scolymus]